MHVEIVTPAPPSSHNGNRVTALRWARLLRELGHRVTVTTAWSGVAADVLVALHARRSAAAARAFTAAHPRRPVIVALTGTDLYQDLTESPETQTAMEAAAALVVLQPLARTAVPSHLRSRVHVIHQSVTVPEAPPDGDRPGRFDVVFLAHLRAVKDPLLVAKATRLLPADSAVRVTHLGAALDRDLGERAAAETEANPRYRWLGDRPRAEALTRLARSRLLVLTSRLEGGANVVSEALAATTPVLSTRIDGSVGLLGRDYPGYFPVGDAGALADLLHRAATDDTYLGDLAAHVQARRDLVDPVRERRAWADLLRAVTGSMP
ncbi:MAG: selenoneine biosynthesis selenosugar synthase SenB [Egibacteraceae bacterium]